MENDNESYKLSYNPPNFREAQKSTLGVKFSKDFFVNESFLKKHNIEYKEEDLENGPMGRGLRIKR